jgi:hypothetical protein
MKEFAAEAAKPSDPVLRRSRDACCGDAELERNRGGPSYTAVSCARDRKSARDGP